MARIRIIDPAMVPEGAYNAVVAGVLRKTDKPANL